MSTNKAFHIGLKSIIETYGDTILGSPQLANILADYSAYEEYPSTRIILKDLIAKGCVLKISESYSQTPNQTLSDIEIIKKDFKKSTRYKSDLVNYIFDSFCYALRLVATVNEPGSNRFDPYANENDSILEELPKMLEELKKEYEKSLKKLLVKPKDIIWDASAYYPASADNILFLISGKIKVIANELGTKDYDWCIVKKKEIITQNQKQKTLAVEEYLNSLKEEYRSFLKSTLIIPSSWLISKSAYFPSNKLNEINQKEVIIQKLYKEKGEQYDGWCEKTKEDIISPFMVSGEKKLFQVIFKVLVPIVVLSIASYIGIIYTSSVDSIKMYDEKIEKAELLESNSDYGKAIALFMSASNNYNGEFLNNSYKSQAKGKADQCFEQIQDKVYILFTDKKYKEINNYLNSIPSEYLANDKEKSDWVEQNKHQLVESINEEVDKIAEMISQNNGNLDEEGLKYLDELLAISPDNYWLRFIKAKEQ